MPRAIISSLSEHFVKGEKDDSQLTTLQGTHDDDEPQVNKVEREESVCPHWTLFCQNLANLKSVRENGGPAANLEVSTFLNCEPTYLPSF